MQRRPLEEWSEIEMELARKHMLRQMELGEADDANVWTITFPVAKVSGWFPKMYPWWVRPFVWVKYRLSRLWIKLFGRRDRKRDVLPKAWLRETEEIIDGDGEYVDQFEE